MFHNFGVQHGSRLQQTTVNSIKISHPQASKALSTSRTMQNMDEQCISLFSCPEKGSACIYCGVSTKRVRADAFVSPVGPREERRVRSLTMDRALRLDNILHKGGVRPDRKPGGTGCHVPAPRSLPSDVLRKIAPSDETLTKQPYRRLMPPDTMGRI